MMSFGSSGPFFHKDRSGHAIRFFRHNGVCFPSFPGDMTARMNSMKDFQARKDDVFICGYPKSGSSWLFEIIHMLLRGNTENFTGNKMATMMEAQDLENLEKLPSPRCLSNHFQFEDIPKDIITKGAKMVYLLRNPKDICVSHFHHNHDIIKVYNYHGDWKDYFHLWLEGKVDYGSWFPYVRDWEKGMKEHHEYSIYLLKYEDLKMNFLPEVKKLAQFLEVSQSEEYFKELAQKTEFSFMKGAKAKLGFSGREKAQWRDNKANFLRKGTVGDWTNHFTSDQIKEFDAAYEDQMKGSELSFIYGI